MKLYMHPVSMTSRPVRLFIAESGIDGPSAVRDAWRSGANAVLVGEHLMRARDPGAALARLVAAGRTAG